MTATPTTPALSTRQTVISLGLGALLWLAAALLLNALSGTGVHDGAARVMLFAAIIPGTAPFILLIDRAAGLMRGQTGPGVAIAVAMATLLDGVALAWAPALYGGADHVDEAGSAILWGAGVAIALGFAYDRVRR
jgi:hypothetical protein